MNQDQGYQKDIESIRKLMERSVKFLSLSGLSGILAGIYALIGAALAYTIIQYPRSPLEYGTESVQEFSIIIKLLGVAIAVLVVSLLTGYKLASDKANKSGLKIWDATSKRLMINLAIPLATGGLFILILLYNGHYGVAASASLVFYGLALINASANLFDEVRYLGYCEIILGLISSLLPGFGLIFWAAGFGVLHIIYGVWMHKKYDQ
jgi:hypothetical protein